MPSSASSVHPSNQPSKGIYLDQQLDPLEDSYANKAAELGFDEMMASRTNFNKIDMNAPQNANEKKWDRNSKMPPTMMKRWFGGGPQTDAEVTLLFKKDLIDIGYGKVAHWQGDPMGKIAMIILCDQLSRNIYRGLAGAFSFDHISQKMSKQIIAKID